MKVEIINKEQVEQLLDIFGETACICYGTPTKFKNGVAKTVLSTGHFSGSRGQYIYFKIEDVPRSLADQMARHSVGTAVNMQSFRYVKMEDFTYYTPSLIEKYPEAKAIYEDTMEVIKHNYNKIVGILFTLEAPTYELKQYKLYLVGDVNDSVDIYTKIR